MRAAVVGLFAIFAATAAHAKQQAQFDAVCNVEFTTVLPDAPNIDTKREVRFSVDTDAGRWCINECQNIEALAGASPEALTLWDDGPTGNARQTRKLVINRFNGLYLLSIISLTASTTRIGTCTAAQFTGVRPKPRF